MNRIFNAVVRRNEELTKGHFLITLQPLKRIKKTRAGNFFMLSVDTGSDPLLKRPLSVHRIVDGNIQFLFRVAGKGTEILSRKKQGEVLDILGPLGNSFPAGKTRGQIILVAGGIGIAPVYCLAEEVSHKAPLLFQGARSKNELLCTSKLRSLGINAHTATDDGSRGYKGNVVALLNEYLVKHSHLTDRSTIFACGPKQMLRSLSELAGSFQINGFMALEEHMACGLGTCLGCVTNTRDGYKRVCKEGPVFSMDEIVWE